MTIEEGNKLITEFMKAKPSNFRMPWEVCRLSELNYNISWDWLMPVVEKIESIFDTHHGHFGVHISSNNCSVQGTYLHMATNDPSDYVYAMESYEDTKIMATWVAAVNFIRWYNLNLKK